MNPILDLAAECGISVCPTQKGMLQVMCTIEQFEDFAERLHADKIAILRNSLEKIVNEDFGVIRPNQCKHEKYWYEPCMECVCEVADEALEKTK